MGSVIPLLLMRTLGLVLLITLIYSPDESVKDETICRLKDV